MLVADTTLIAYLWIEGEFTSEALRVLALDAEWCAPRLWESEFANVLLRYVKRKDLDLENALRRFDAAKDHLLDSTYDVDVREALRWSTRSGCTIYDSQYVVLAHQLGIPLVTHDQKILDAHGGLAVNPATYLAK